MNVINADCIGSFLRKYTCQICNRIFTSIAGLSRHTVQYSNSHSLYPCCREPFVWSKDCLKHTCPTSSHEIYVDDTQNDFHINDDNSPDENVNESAFVAEDNRSFKCNNCPAKFSRYQSVKNHIIKYPSIHNHTCDKCMKLFFTEEALKKHLCLLAEAPFQCSCNFYFDTLQKFRLHVGHKRPYYCCACKKKNVTFNNLINHIRSHTKENTYVCDLCNKTFRVRESLRVHQKLHGGEKSYHCSKCSYSTSRKWNLQLHEKRHNPERKNDRQYLCTECGTRFFQKHHLKRHSAIHNQPNFHLCLKCGKLFTGSSYLKKHLEKHKNDSDIGYKCAVCEAEILKGDMYRHHLETGHLQHVCHPCKRVFPSKFNLQRHLKTHNKPTNTGTS